MKIDLDDVLEAMGLAASDGYIYFYNKETGETVMYSDPVYTGTRYGGLERELEQNADNYVRFPTQYEINQYHIMEEFIWILPDGAIHDKLQRVLQRKGACRKFKSAVYGLGMEQKWFEFEVAAYKKMAKDWCKDHGLQYM